jgi:filamentous hemagglutinin family protein
MIQGRILMNNKAFQVIWNHARQCYMVVSEIATRAGKTKSKKSISLSLASGASLLVSAGAFADAIIPDGRTLTSLAVSGNLTEITTNTLHGINALNSFQKFNIDNGQTVNLHLPTGASNLLNLVHNEQSVIDGVMNAYKDGRIGGNIFFLNPHGIVVGAGGLLNVGSLTMATPTRQFMDSIISPSGVVNDGAVSNVLSGFIPLTESGLIQVKGRINAVNSLNIKAGQVIVDAGAQLIAGHQAIADFADLVNVQDIAIGTGVEVVNGVIRITAAGNVDIAGQLVADGIEGQNAGQIEIKAGQDIHLSAGADVSASGQGLYSSGGVVDVLAQQNAVIATGAKISANAGDSGDGGFVEFSAKRTVELAGGTFSAEGHDGLAGEVLIDPENIIISANLLRDASGYGTLPVGGGVAGANITLIADETITVNADVTVSSRLVTGTSATNHANYASIGDSGDITFQASDIKLLNGSKVLANGSADDTTHAGGDVTLIAKDVAFDLLGYKKATATIEVGDDVGGATIKGRKVTLSANALAENKWLLSSGNAEQNAVDLATTALTIGAQALGVKAIYSQADATAEVIIREGSLIDATGTVTLEAITISTAGSDLINTLAGATPLLVNKIVETPLALGGMYARVDANSTVEVESNTTINAANFSANTHNTADLDASLTAAPADPLDNDSSQVITIAVGITEAEVNAKTSISGTLGVSGNVQVTAVNNGSYQNEVVGKTGAAGRAAAAVSYATRETDATAELKANVTDATKVEVFAVNNVSKDFVSAKVTAGLAGFDEISTNLKENKKASVKSASSSLKTSLFSLLGLDTAAPKPPANNGTATEVKFRLSGAIAYADSKDEANASIQGATVKVHATDHIAVNALVNAENTKISAKSSAVSNSSKTQSVSDTSREGYSAGLAIGNYVHNATATVGADITLTAPRISISSQTLMPIVGSSTFGTPVKTLNKYDTLPDIHKWVDDRQNDLDELDPFFGFNGVSRATAKANESQDSIALSGSASILNYDSSSRALVEKGARLNLSKDAAGLDVVGPWSTDALEIIRAMEAKSIPLIGTVYQNARSSVSYNFDFDEAAEVSAVHESDLRFQGGAMPSSTGSEKGLGIAVNDIDVTSLTEAVVREAVIIQGVTETAGVGLAGTRTWTVDSQIAAPEVNVVADSKDTIMSITNAAGAGATFGVNGSVSIVTGDTTTRALVDDEVGILAKSLSVSALSSPVIWSISGGINLSKNASVGVGIAVNDITTVTNSEIADNDIVSTNDVLRTSLINISDSTITTPELDVIARTSGRVEAIAIAGAIANNAPNSPGEPGFMEKLKTKTGYTKVMTFAEGLSGMNKDGATRPRSDSTPAPEPKKEKKPPTYSFAGAGSGVINLTEMSTMAKVEGVTIVQTVSNTADPVSLVVRAISDSDITAASGAAAITRAKDPDTEKTVGIAGSVAVNSIGNGTQAWLKNSTITDAGDVTVQALSGGEQLAVALGMAVDASTGPAVKKSDSFVGSLSLTLAQTDDNDDSKNKTVAKVDNTDITSKALGTGRDVDITAYSRTYIGTGGGSLAVSAGSASKGTSIGAAVSWANVRNDVSATIEGDSHLLGADSVSVHAYNATEIGAGAAMLGLSKAEGANSFAGSLVVNQITNNTTAAIEKSTVTATGLVDVEARDKGADAALETLIDPDGDRDNTAKGLDYCGENAGAASPTGNCIAAVAGTVQLGKGKNFGVSIAYNQIKNNLTAKVKDSTVTVSGTAITDKINVIAQSDTSILGVAFGVGASSKMSGAGSLSIASIKNNVFAEVGQSKTGGSATTLNAPTVTIASADDAIIHTVAGQVNVSTTDKALGAAFAYNKINNVVHSIVDTAMITASNEVAITAQENAKIESVSAAAGLAKGTAVSLSASLNFIDNSSEARVSESRIEDGSTTGGTNTVKITATDGSYETTIDPTNVDPTIEEQLDDQYSIRSIAGSVGGSYSGAGVGAAFSLNQVSNANKVLVENSTIEGAKVFELKALEKAIIRTFAGAVGAGKSGFSGSITLNNIGQSFVGSNPNSTTAELHNSSVSGGAGSSIKVEGRDDSMIESYAGALAVGLSGSAIGGAIADNNIQATAKGNITNSTITDSASVGVTGLNKAKIKSASIAAAGGSSTAFGGSASSNRTENETYGEIIDSDITGSSSVVNVKATNESDIQALSGGAAVSFSSAAVGIAISVNDIDDTTSAHVTGKKASGFAVKDMQVAAASDATIKALSIGAAGASGTAAAGSVGVSLISSTTSAYIDGDAVVLAENNIGVTAESDDVITVISGSAAVGFGAAGAGVGFNVNSITSNTEAYISGVNTSVTGLAKDAEAVMDVYNGELTVGVNLENQVNTLTFAALDLKNNKSTKSVSGVAVNASSSQQIENITGTIGASTGIGAGIAAGVNVIGGTTEAYVLNAKINDNNTDAGATQQVDINASNIAYDNSFIVAVGIGANAGGLGVDTHVMNRTTSAKVAAASVDAINTVTVKAESTQGISSLAAGGAAGGNAGAGTLSLALFENTTEAIVDDSTVKASALEIKAKNTNDMFLMAGAVSIGGNAGGGAFAIGSSDSNTNAKLSTKSGVTVNGAVTVDAINKTNINHIVVSGAGGGGVGVAGMADVNLVTDQTLATIEDSTIGTAGAKAATVHVAASHTLDVDSKAGALGVGITGSGVGAGASVNIIKANTVATVSGSTIYADGHMDVTATSIKHVDATALTAGVGGTVGIGGAAVVTLVGDDVGGDAADEVEGSLSAVNEFTSGDKFEDIPDTGADGPTILSAADKAALNSDTTKSTTGVTGSAGGYAFKTAAEIKGSNTMNSGSLDVIATDKTDTKTLVGGFGASLGGGIGGGVAVTNVKANVAANVSGTALTTNGDVNVKATADNDAGKTIEVLALAGGAGLVGLGAAVSYVDITNHVGANLTSGANAGAGTVTVSAEDKTDIESDAKGAAVGAAAAGVVISNAKKNSTVDANVGGIITAASATIFAADEGLVKAIGQSAVAGLGIGIGGAIVDASDTSHVTASTADNATFDLAGGTLNLTATGTPKTSARADGVAVSANVGIGASVAHANSSAIIKATMGSNNTVTASELNIKAIRALNTSGAPSSFAKAIGASGGLLLGANATTAKAFSGGSTMAAVGSESTLLVSGTTTVKGESESQQTSSGLGLSAGLVAFGSDYSEAKSSTYTSAVLGSNVKVTGDRLDVLASSEDTNYAYGVAGSGGALSAPFSEAKTINESETYANTGSGNNTLGNERKIDVTSLNIDAKHDAHFDSWMESTNASLLGASGAKATNTVVTTSGAYIGSGGYVEADNITLDATNAVLKAGPASTLIPGLTNNVPTWNVNSSSGGLADVPAAGSNTIIATQALVQVGDSAHLEQTLEQTGLQSAPGVFTLNALNNVTATDKVKMSSGGLVSAASGESSILADNNNATVRVNDNSVTTGMGDIAMGARSIADISTQTAVDVYGLVGVAPAGDSVSSFKSKNTINIGAASIDSLNDIKLSAGANTAGQANDMKTTARSDVYNNTAIPANRDPIADAIIGSHSQINIASGADLGAVRHIALFAEEGSATASGIGIGKDIYREALAKVASAVSNAFGGGDVSFETKTGNSTTSQTSGVTVDGEVHVGIHRKQLLEIGFDGAATSQTAGISITNTDFKAVAADILARINALNELIRKYTVEDAAADASIAVAAYKSEIKFLERKLTDINPPADSEKSGFNGVANISAKVAAESSVEGMTQTRDAYLATKTKITSDNTTLSTNITTLNTDNAALSDNNTALTSANITLQTDIAALNGNNDADAIATKKAKEAALTLNELSITSNNSSFNDNESTIKSNRAEISVNEGLIADLNAKITPLDTTISSTQKDIDNNVFSTTVVGGPVAKILTISDAKAQLGNIYVRGDKLQGSGSLDAPGDAEIKIVNNGSSFLKLNDLIIPPDEGGKIYLNSIDVNDNTEINSVNGTAGADFTIFTADSQIDSAGNAVTPGKPQILIESKYDPLSQSYIDQTPVNTPTLAPDIIMTGEVSNLRGLVKVESAAGSIRVEETANIRAGTVDIKTKNGDFVQSYAKTIFHVNGGPLTITPGNPDLESPGNIDSIVRTPERAGGGIVANGSVLISARYLNVNGNIQSGIPEWGVKIPGAATVNLGTTSGTFAQAQTTYNALTAAKKAELGSEFYAVNDATVKGLAGNEQGDWEKIDVYYNAKENRLELGGVQVQGGYIELFGEIFNTNSANNTDIAQNIGGKLRVLDGYGQINVDNKTNLALWVNLLDTGRGVQGEINISNITGLDANNVPVITTQTFTRNSGDARTGQTYSPTSGLSYSMMVGYDSMTTDFYRYSQNGWFGITSAPVEDQYKISSVDTENDPLSRAAFLQNTPNLDLENEVVETTTTSNASPVAGASWKDCNWWTLCANATYYQEYTVARGDKTTKTQSVKGDNPINIEFIGFDNGTVNVASTGSIVFNSAVNNRDGNITVNSGGSITQNGDLAIMNGNNISLNSASGMGDAAQSLLLNVNSGGKLDAISSSGELHLTQVVGDLQVGSIGGAGVSKVILEAERSLLGGDANSNVQAQRVELLARNGGIGELSNSVDTQFKISTGYTSDQSQWSDKGLIATARESINIINTEDVSNASAYSGDLLLISAESQAGDVHIETTGKTIDNNPFATTDTRTQTELANLWDSMALRGTLAEDKANFAVQSYAKGQESNYQQYWQLRSLQADGGVTYDATFKYQISQPQTDAMIASGMTRNQVVEFADSRTVQYHQLNEQVGAFTAVFDDGYSFDIASIESNIREGSSWTDAQLQLSVGSGLLKNITDTVTTIKTPNVKGNNISLIAGTDIGSFDDVLTINLAVPLTDLTIEQKAALAAAERGDVTVNGSVLSIMQARPVNVTTGAGALTADANGLMLLGSEKDLRINQVTTAGDIRIKTSGALVNVAAAGVVNVSGQNIILEAANGGIGSETAPLLLDAEFGSGVTARAKNDIWMKSLFDFNIDTMYSPNNINIDAQGSIFDFQMTEVQNSEDLNIRGNYVMLTAQNGSIGTAVNALDVSVNKDGLIHADASTVAQSVYLNGTHNERFRVGSVTSDNEVFLTSADDVVLEGGAVTAPNNIKLKAGTDGSGSVLVDSGVGSDIVALGILDVQATDSIGGEFALEAQVSTQANFRASDINVNVTNKPVDHSLLLSVSDVGGGPANSVIMNVTSNNAVYFDTFNAVTAEIAANAPSIDVSEGSITNYAVFNMPLYSTRFDTLSRNFHPGYDVNAHTIDGNFIFNGLTSSVDVGAYIIDRNPFLEWTGDVPADVVSTSNEVMQEQPAGNTPIAQDPKKINVWASTEDLAKNLYSGVTLVSVSGDWFNAITSIETQAKLQNPENIKEIEINENN